MNPNLRVEEWKITEEGFNPEMNRASESIFSIGNGYMGQRANFEEHYSGDTLRGSYIAGIYYPDKTRVGWWKNGYPEYFAKVINSPAWTGISIRAGGEEVDLARCEVLSFRRELNMREGYLHRSFRVRLVNGLEIEAEVTRFVSSADREAGVIRYTITPLNGDTLLTVESSVDADVYNEDANYNEYFWEERDRESTPEYSYMETSTRKTGFRVAIAARNILRINDGKPLKGGGVRNYEKYVSRYHNAELKKGDRLVIEKYVAVTTSLNHSAEALHSLARDLSKKFATEGFDKMLNRQKEWWKKIWDQSDVVIEGDPSAQQAIRFNIFHLFQTYDGHDERLNIGPKGFTGEKYGGSTYWDTEAFALPFYLSTADSSVARNLLLYRYRHLPKAIENASALGIGGGAALYPMVTMNGEECHNEWEITFEEIHRNGAMAYAIYRYINQTGDYSYMLPNGLEVLIALSRYWSRRASFSQQKKSWVILGVTGPNEYENNVNNNWYTNLMAVWTLRYTLENIERTGRDYGEEYKRLSGEIIPGSEETALWREIAENMYFPEDKERGIFVQQDGYLDKELLTTDTINPDERPINQHWSWDRILRSCYIKQADVLQGIYLFEDDYDMATIKRNFDFYEPYTVHESSLSPSIHSVLASLLGYTSKAYELYLRTARLDLDDYNREVKEGLHITSMAGTWLSIVEGFGGMRIKNDRLFLNPVLPEAWKSLSFMMRFRNNMIRIRTSMEETTIINLSDQPVPVTFKGREYLVEPGEEKSL
jgi:maltose phosphorylase